MTAEQRGKIQHAIQALIDVEAALQHSDSIDETKFSLHEIHRKLSDARTVLADLNAPDYN